VKKRIACLIILFASAVFVLTGCTKVDISIGIDESFTAYVSYRIEMDVGVVDTRYQSILENALHKLAWHYQEELGFSVLLELDSDPCVLTMTRRVTNSSFEQAFASLEGMLTNEAMTPFMMVDMAAQASERQNRYSVVAMADIAHILRLSNAEELPPALFEEFAEAVGAGSGSITLTLPASEVVKSSHDVSLRSNQAKMSAPLSFSEQTNIEFAALINMLRDGEPGGSLEEILRGQYDMRSMAVFISGAVLLVLLVALVIRIARRR